MFQTMLAVAIPALVTLTAAFFILRHLTQEEEEQRSQRWGSRRQRTHSSFPRAEQNIRNRRPRRADSAGRETGECVVCYEERAMVEVYPCGHTNLCGDCVNKLICSNRKVCPFCRSRIQGYSEL